MNKYLIILLFLSFSVCGQSLTKETSYQITITEEGILEARKTTKILEDGKVISKSYYRFNGAIEPGETIPEELPENYKEAIRKVWTEDFIKNYKIKKAEKNQK